jgi:hypothetical protein
MKERDRKKEGRKERNKHTKAFGDKNTFLLYIDDT